MSGGRLVIEKVSFLFDGFAKRKRDTKSIGDRSEAAVLYALVEAGYLVSVPFGENHRYDLIIERADTALSRVQVKTGRLRGSIIQYAAFSTHEESGRYVMQSYAGQVEFVALYCPQNRGVYLIPAEYVPKFGGHLRIEQPANGQKKRIRWASDFHLRDVGVADGTGLEAPNAALRLELTCERDACEVHRQGWNGAVDGT